MLSSMRLRKIAEMVVGDYLNVWDCCCDHGQLGIELLAKTPATLHFVDCEKHLVSTLQSALLCLPQYAGRWCLHCTRVEDLQLSTDGDQLIIIAGVGGDTCTAMVKSLLARHQSLAMDIILCPVRQVEQLRTTLALHDLGLVNECLVKDRAHFYEILHLRRFDKRGIASIMKSLAPADNVMHKRYIENRVRYLESAPTSDGANALCAYKALLK